VKVVFLKDFEKAITKIKDPKLAQTIKILIQTVEISSDLNSIPNIKKLKGHKNAYRIRVGNHRIGFFFLTGVMTFAAFDYRKDIYKKFP
jgi:mRNA-degrading endonuclease RelE of RelBE toxin-antitoxin system